MTRHGDALRAAHTLWRTDERLHSVLAVGIVVFVFGPPVYRFWRASRGNAKGRSVQPVE